MRTKADRHARDLAAAREIHEALLRTAQRMAEHLLDQGYAPEDVSTALITIGVCVAEGRMKKDQAVGHLRDLLADIAGMH